MYTDKDESKVEVLPVHLAAMGELQQYISMHPDTHAVASDPQAAKLLEEAQANLRLAAATGYTPELRRNFSIFLLLGVGFGLTNSWFGISASLITGIASGGPMLIIYGIIIVAAVSLAIGASLSELTSAMPSAGGQYYWTMKLAPPRWAPFLSYMCGAFAWAGAVFTLASVTIAIASALVGMYALGSGGADFEVKTWQVFVTYEVVNVFLLVFNVWERPLPAISQWALYMLLGSFVVISIVVLAKSLGHYALAHFVFVEFQNGTGWLSLGIAFIVGLINPNWLFLCLDCATHMAEEIVNPERQIPLSIMLTVVIGFVTSFAYSIAMFFCISDLDLVLNSLTGVPIMDIFYQALRSKAGAIVLEVLIVLTAVGCNIALHTWQARLCWSFARDCGLPGLRWWLQINARTKQPVNAHLMSCGWCAVIGCIYMGSTTAYNAMVTGCIVFLLLLYLVPVLCLLYKGRDNIEHGPFWLGKLGAFCNYVLVLWTVFGTVFYSFPAVMPVEAGSMNYVCVVIGVYGAYCVIYWFARGKRTFLTVADHIANAHELTLQLLNQVQSLEMIVSHQREVN